MLFATTVQPVTTQIVALMYKWLLACCPSGESGNHDSADSRDRNSSDSGRIGRVRDLRQVYAYQPQNDLNLEHVDSNL